MPAITKHIHPATSHAVTWQPLHGELPESPPRARELPAAARDLIAAVSQDVRASYAAADAALRQATFIRDALIQAAREK